MPTAFFENETGDATATAALFALAADAVRATRPFSYEVTFVPASGKAVVKRMLAANVYKPDGDYWSAKGETMTVCLDQLPSAPFKIEVRAVSSLESRSAPLEAAFGG